MRADQEATIDLMQKNAKLRDVMDDIRRMATLCYDDMQGRLQDDEHKRAHRVIFSIARMADGALLDT